MLGGVAGAVLFAAWQVVALGVPATLCFLLAATYRLYLKGDHLRPE